MDDLIRAWCPDKNAQCAACKDYLTLVFKRKLDAMVTDNCCIYCLKEGHRSSHCPDRRDRPDPEAVVHVDQDRYDAACKDCKARGFSEEQTQEFLRFWGF